MKKFFLVASIPVESVDNIKKMYVIKDVDFIELRVDYLENPLAIDYESINASNIIVTLRDVEEGGVKKHKDSIKLALLNKLTTLGIMYDIEINFIKKYNVDYIDKIVSIHILNPDRVDLNLIRKDVEMFVDKAFVVKIATKPFPGYKKFLIELLELGDNIAVMPIGVNPVERIAFALLGSKLLYCFIDKPTASGQPRCNDIKRLLSMLTII